MLTLFEGPQLDRQNYLCEIMMTLCSRHSSKIHQEVEVKLGVLMLW